MTSFQRIYLDHNATTPVDPRVMDAMLPYFSDCFGNPASVDHEFGYEAKLAVDRARDSVAKSIGAHSDEIVFTSGATESNNLALFGVAERYAERGDHIITCQTEHKAVLDSCRRLAKLGKKVTYLPVDWHGHVHLDELEKAITERTVLISVMAANNEIGTIAPLAEIGAIAQAHGVLFHTDAAQAVGHVPVDVQTMGVHLLSISAHKTYGPKGVGALYVRSSNPRARLSPVIYGGGHERGMRSGTLNVPGVVGLGEALRIADKQMTADAQRFRSWGVRMLNELRDSLGDVELNGHPTERLPNNLNLYFPRVESKALIVQLKDVAVATGSACTSLSVEPSHVIEALGFGAARAHSSVRIGFGRFNTDEEIGRALVRIADSVKGLRALS